MFNHTGVLRNVTLCKIENTDIEFLFGYVVKHVSPKFNKDDWFATSYLVKIDKVDDYFMAETANSIYHISDYQSLNIPIEALDNIRTGTPPEKALQILQVSFTQILH
jgi:hypothetical protein